jgi:hypothetical protein
MEAVGKNVAGQFTFSRGDYEDGCLLDCYAVKSGTSLPTFQRCLLKQLSGRCISPMNPEDSHLHIAQHA